MVFGNDGDDEEVQLLLSKSSHQALQTSKRTLAETRQVGEEVLRNLEVDSEKIDALRRKQSTSKGQLGEAERHMRAIERNALLQQAFVCLVLCAVVFGFLVVLLRMLIK
jgi:hypothetical protein